MLLQAAIVPPRAVLEAVANVVDSVDAVDQRVAVERPRRWPRARPASRSLQTAESPIALDQIHATPAEQVFLTLAAFGNMTADDVLRVAETLRAAAATWPRPTLHVEGGTSRGFPDDLSVWAKLEGDAAPLMTIAQGVHERVARLGFFVDRRRCRPRLAVAALTEATSAAHLESVVGALDAFRGEDWTVGYFSLMKASFNDAKPGLEEMHRIALGPR